MTDRVRKEIEYYIPHDPDPTLEDGEYYLLQYTSGVPRVIKVRLFDILPCSDGMEYGMYQQRRGQWVRIDAGWCTPNRGHRKGDLYDNKEDCREQTHCCCHWWEELRAEQMKERSAQKAT